MNYTYLLPAIRELDSRHPEYFHEPWELAAAVEVARGDWPQWRAA